MPVDLVNQLFAVPHRAVVDSADAAAPFKSSMTMPGMMVRIKIIFRFANDQVYRQHELYFIQLIIHYR